MMNIGQIKKKEDNNFYFIYLIKIFFGCDQWMCAFLM